MLIDGLFRPGDLPSLLGQVFLQMPHLAELKTECGLTDCAHVTWSLPNLRVLTMRESQLPVINAPNLRLFHVCGSAGSAAAARILLQARNIESIRVQSYWANESCDPEAFEMVASAIRQGLWPALHHLNFLASHDTAAQILGALLVSPRPSLEHVHCSASSDRELRAFLRTHNRANTAIIEDAQPKQVQRSTDRDLKVTHSECVLPMTDLTVNVCTDLCFDGFRFTALHTLKMSSRRVVVSTVDVILRACPALRYLSLRNVNMGSYASALASGCKLEALDVDVCTSEASNLNPAVTTRELAQLITSPPLLSRLYLAVGSLIAELLTAVLGQLQTQKGSLANLKTLALDVPAGAEALAVLKELVLRLPSLASVNAGLYNVSEDVDKKGMISNLSALRDWLPTAAPHVAF